MHRVSLSIAALLLAAIPTSSGAVPKPATAPRPSAVPTTQALTLPKAGDTIDLTGLDYADEMARRPVRRSVPMSALALKALRAYATGARSSDPVDRSVAKTMGRIRNGRKIANRILARIDALPASTRDATFGPADPKDTTSTLATRATAGAISPLFSGIGVSAANTLPAEGVADPSSYKLQMSGLATHETSDGDGDGDELVVLSTFVRMPSNSAFAMTHSSAPESSPLVGLTAGDVTPLDRLVFDVNVADALLVTAAFEIDGDEVAAREEYLAMVALAEPLALQLFQASDTIPTRLGRFAFALDYTIGLLAASDPARWPQGVLQKTKFGSFGMTLASLHATPESTDGAVKWRLAHQHDLPAGNYTVYFDLPAPPPPVLPNVKVKITRVESLSAEPGGDDLVLQLGIDGPSKTKTLPGNKNVHDISWTVQRIVNPGAVQIRISLNDASPGPAYGYEGQYSYTPKCGTWPGGAEFAPCPDVYRMIDVDPGGEWKSGDAQGRIVVLHLDTVTGKITAPGGVDSTVGQAMTLTGGLFPKGKLKVLVTTD